MARFFMGFDITSQGGMGTTDAGGGEIVGLGELSDLTSNIYASVIITEMDYSNGITYNSDTNQWICAVANDGFYIYNSLEDIARNSYEKIEYSANYNYNNGIAYNSDTDTYFAAYQGGGTLFVEEYKTLSDAASRTGIVQTYSSSSGVSFDNGIEYDSVTDTWYGAYSGTLTSIGGVRGFDSLDDLLNFSAPIVEISYNSTVTDFEMGLAIVPCFMRGTLIETQTGSVPVEKLSKGDLVRTLDADFQPVSWIGSRRLSATELTRFPELRPIRISAGALGENTPAKDLFVSPQHRVLVRSAIAQTMFDAKEVLVAAKQLLEIDGIDIVEDLGEAEYFHILFDRHQIVFSNQAATESLYTGPQALRSVGPRAREEIFRLFPELRVNAEHPDYMPESARVLISGRKARNLAKRHAKHNRSLVSL